MRQQPVVADGTPDDNADSAGPGPGPDILTYSLSGGTRSTSR